MLALLTLAAATAAPPAIQPSQRCPAADHSAIQSSQRLAGPRKLGQEPPAQGYKAVLRKRDGCVTPVTFPIASPR